MDKLAYLGWSWGGNVATRMVAIEDQFRACVIMGGGLQGSGVRELDGRMYAPFITIPVLMLGGKLDTVVSFPARQMPLLKALEACPDKTMETFDSGHVMPLEESIAKIDQWLDKRVPQTDQPGGGKTDWLRQLAERSMKQNRFREAEGTYAEIVSLLTNDKGLDHRDTLAARRSLAKSVCFQGRHDQGAGMLEECLKKQEELFGAADEDTVTTAQQLASHYDWMSLQRAKVPNGSPREYERAVQLAQQSIEIATRFAFSTKGVGRVRMALAYYRLQRWNDCFESVSESLVRDDPDVSAWLILSMCQYKLGREQSSKDWYAAACELMSRYSTSHPITAEASAVLQMPVAWPPNNWTPSNSIEVYTRLISEQPDLARLYRSRGACYGRLGDWNNALADYTRAAEADPNDFSHWEARAAVCLAQGDVESYGSVCRNEFERFRTGKSLNLRMCWVLMSSLGASRPVNPVELDRTAAGVLATPGILQGQLPYYSLARGMALYRSERWEEALEILPTSGFLNPKDEILALIFRAMTHAQLGDAYTSRRLVEEARKQARTQLMPLDGPELRVQDRAVVVSMVRAALCEADSLIGPRKDLSKSRQSETTAKIARQDSMADGSAVLQGSLGQQIGATQ